MGEPKLLLPLGDDTVIGHVLSSLRALPTEHQLVVARPDDDELSSVLVHHGVRLVRPKSAPPDMRSSVECALRRITEDFQPTDEDSWMLVPADSVTLKRHVVDKLIQVWRTTSEDILIPVHGERRGHPAFFKWRLAEQLFQIDPTRGVNALRQMPDVTTRFYPVDDACVLADLDTPEEYTALTNELSKQTRESKQ